LDLAIKPVSSCVGKIFGLLSKVGHLPDPENIEDQNAAGLDIVENDVALIDKAPDVAAEIFIQFSQKWSLGQRFKQPMKPHEVEVGLILAELKE
jgi:hypothetical protein